MKVLIIASESHPFIKTGGLGDVIGALPHALKNVGVDARVVMPNYRDIKDDLKKKFKFIKSFIVKVGWREQYCGIFEYDHDGVKYYFIDNEYYFKRDGLYGYYDDGEKFAFFDRAVLEFIKEIDWKPDVLHCNDWQTGMIPVLHKVEYIKKDLYKNMKTVFSIHNLFFKGSFSPDVLPEVFGYDYELFNNGSLELNGAVSFLKGAINYSDSITTVSKSYAEEIKTPEYGEGLDGLIRYKQNILRGITNGIDYKEYDPKNDKFIFKQYSVDTLENKGINKEELQNRLGLTVNKNIPMIGMVSRLTHQKGCDLIINMLHGILQKDVQVVFLGTGDYLYEENLKDFNQRYPNKVSANILFDNELAHKIYASSDMFLMPSLFEPCGLGQLIALRYGSVPIVRETGGLKDTITDYNSQNKEGNGFTFRDYNYIELMEKIEYSIEVYKNKDNWQSLVMRAMNSYNSWDKSAEEYKKLYKELMA
ncbi:glycogen synthase GlgA [Clostridium gasigenes]|uniref:glycogen synthase GlgA n=1 Tax=Clostridium gasigenes TaxID=94869 RepID=UPI001C0B38E6|nr:glycogen synthase GlgA [Clostridium gasigenes]MBU3134582.1 glycogen synthase GlgA [Clostridium gasigenes]